MKYLVTLLFLILCSCTQKTNTNSGAIPQSTSENELVKYEDKAAGVVCYRVRMYEGLHCFIDGDK